jgi:hypothetical protein
MVDAWAIANHPGLKVVAADTLPVMLGLPLVVIPLLLDLVGQEFALADDCQRAWGLVTFLVFRPRDRDRVRVARVGRVGLALPGALLGFSIQSRKGSGQFRAALLGREVGVIHGFLGLWRGRRAH